MIKRTEALADAIASLNRAHIPDSTAYKIRNPLLLRSYAKLGKHQVNGDGLRIFGSMLAGMKAGLYDLELKIKGLSRAGLTPDDCLGNLLGCYGISDKYAVDKIVSFIKRALLDETLSINTPLSFFLADFKGVVNG